MDEKFVIDKDQDMACLFGSYDGHDGIITYNCARMDSIRQLVATIEHEWFHKIFDELEEDTTEDQDHYIIPRLLF